MSKLPKGWVECKLGEIVFSRKGKKPKNTSDVWKESYVPYLLIDEMEGKKIRSYTNDNSVPMVTKNDVLLVWDGSIGKCASGLEGAIGSTLVGLTPLGGIPTKFIEYTLKQKNRFIKETSTGTGLQHINKEFFKICDVAVPPLAEQKRIVEKLDKLLPKVEEAKTRLEKIPLLLKRFRQSVLNAAVTGELTKDWRESEELNDWEKITFEKIILDGPQNGLYKPQEYYGEGTPILRIDNFYDGKIKDWSELKRLKLSKSEIKTYSLDDGDIVINRVNSMTFLGKSALVRKLSEVCVFESNMMRIKLNIEISFPEYIISYLNSIPGLIELRKNAKHAVNQSSINQQDVKAVLINLPPLNEQKEIVRRVESLFKKADEIEERYKKAKEFVDKLTQSILAKAFRGELVPQDPNDEPASVLLERIKLEKEKLNKDKKQKKKSSRQVSLRRNIWRG